MHPMLVRACNVLHSPHVRLGAFIAYEIDAWIADIHADGLRWCDLDDRPRKYLGGESIRALVLNAIIERSTFLPRRES